jgi:hypothetical protein
MDDEKDKSEGNLERELYIINRTVRKWKVTMIKMMKKDVTVSERERNSEGDCLKERRETVEVRRTGNNRKKERGE